MLYEINPTCYTSVKLKKRKRYKQIVPSDNKGSETLVCPRAGEDKVCMVPVPCAHLRPHLGLLLLEPLLLVADDGAGPADAQPGHRLQRRPAPVLHDVAPDQRPRAAQTSLAVH